jgi:hypothetical protein
MKKTAQLLPTLFFASMIYSQLSTALSQGTAFTYQGKLNDGANAAAGSYDLKFAIYDSSSNGNAIGNPLTNSATSISNGLFTTTLDFGASVFTGPDRWLEISVRTNGGANFTVLSARQKLTPTPYAIFAESVGVGGLATGTNSNALTFNNSGNNFNGSFSGNGAGVSNVNATLLNGQSAANFWNIGGNSNTTAGVNFLGTRDNQPLELHVGGLRAIRFEPNPNGGPNVIGGSPLNYVSNGVVGATIGGGGAFSNSFVTIPGSNSVYADFGTIAGGFLNSVTNWGGTVGGGRNNSASFIAFVGGGGFNNAGGPYSFVGGGEHNSAADFASVSGGYANQAADSASVGGGTENIASGTEATIGGGEENVASGLVSTVAGGTHNQATGEGAFIGGGGFAGSYVSGNVARGAASVLAGGYGNLVTNQFGFIGGGQNNTNYGEGGAIGGGEFNSISSAPYATVSGGVYNQANAFGAAVGGGNGNIANGTYGTIPGGYSVTASGSFSFAAGRQAQALHQGAFVWADSTIGPYSSDRNDQFKVRANGGMVLNVSGSVGLNPAAFLINSTSANGVGMYIVETSGDAALVVNNAGTGSIIKGFNGGANPVFEVVHDGTVYSKGIALTSDRNVKEDFSAIRPAAILEKVTALPITQWSYKADSHDVLHLGPMAQDFHAAFGLNGGDDKHISVVDEGGVALAAIQGLNEKVEGKAGKAEAEIQQLKTENAELKRRLDALEKTLLAHHSD